jgi:uncharacterized protein YdhG (YjbR/CyaY superfamily)
MADSTKFTTHDDYIAAAHPDAQLVLRQIQQTLEACVPLAVRCISYNMPAYKLECTFFYFAAFKRHVGVYPPVSDDAQLIKDLAPYRNERGNLAFPLAAAVPYGLIERVVFALADQYGHKSAKRAKA